MTDYTALRAASESFRLLLKTNITDSPEPDLNGIPVDLRSPEALGEQNITIAVSLWCYQVMVQPDMLNMPPRRVADDAYEHRPLPLELLYLITAIHPDAGTQLALTGRALQVINDHPRLRGTDLKDTLTGTDAELRLSIDATTLSESSELWYSLRSPFHMSVPARLQVASIDSQQPSFVGPTVLTRRADMLQTTGPAS